MAATAEDRPRVSASRRGTHLSDGCNSARTSVMGATAEAATADHRLIQRACVRRDVATTLEKMLMMAAMMAAMMAGRKEGGRRREEG